MSDQLSLFGPPEHVESPTIPQDVDRDARAFAQDPEQNVVLEASAGTGKTSVLVARYINLLVRGVDPANILAITFTRKAAAEMRERIVRDLRRSAEQSTLDRARWLSLRDRLADIQVGTIDAFCLALLREFPLEADLDPGFTLADETEVPRLMEQSLDKALRIFVGLAKREPEIALVLAQLGLNRTREGLAHLLDRRLVAWDVLDRFLARAPEDLTAEDACRRTIARLIDLFSGIPGGLEAFLDDGPLSHPRYQLLAIDLRRLSTFVHADNAAVKGLVERIAGHFLTGAGKARASERIHPYVADEYPTAARGKRHRAAALAASSAVEQIVAGFARDLNAVLARGIRRMFSIAVAQYRIALDDRSVLDFSDVLHRAVDLLGRMDEFSQSRFRLEGRYHHVLVDEFQDTSRKQWELVSLLVKAWGEGLGVANQPSIFIVGDRKQSIYRFRDADVSVLHDAAAFIDGLRPGSTSRRSIVRSFRAVPELLAFVNELFAEVGRVDGKSPDDFTYGEGDRFPVEPVVSDARGPALGLVVSEDPLVCAANVADEIDRIVREEMVRDRQTGMARRARPGDIGILFRSRTSHREFERALEARGIPTYVYKGLGFFDADEIKDLSALIRFLANPASDLRAAAFLRSRFVRLSDEALAHLAPSLASALTASTPPAALESLAVDDRTALEQVRRHVSSWIEHVDRVPPADLIEQILPDTAYAYELRGPRFSQAWENVKKMRGLIRRIQNRGYATLARIAEHLDSLTAGDESNAVLEAVDAVNLMTVHASKGLEFPVVFVVNMAKGATGPPKPVRVGRDSVSVGPFVSETDEDEKGREREETKRLLYVALTRARDRLYLATLLKDGRLVPGRGSLAEVLPESIRDLFVRAATAFEELDKVAWTAQSARVFEFRRCVGGGASDGVDRESRPDAPVADRFGEVVSLPELERETVSSILPPDEGAAGAVARESHGTTIGALVHRLIQSTSPSATHMDVVDVAPRLLRIGDGVSVAERQAVSARAVAILQSIKAQPGVADLLTEGQPLFEVPFSMLSGDGRRVLRGTIDCIVRRPDESIAVLEFKTGRPQPAHDVQLCEYVRAAQAMYPATHVEGHLIYADDRAD
jgi:ATP-dependent helicase/nuclease subunit A